MMILRSTPASPFGRKVNLAASVLGLSGEIRIEPADLTDAADSVRRQNPLGKIPTLVLEDGSTLFDSRVILEYLDHRAGGGKIIPREPNARFAALRLQALADGMTDASDPAGLRRPLAAAGAPRAEMDRLPGRQDQARPRRAGGRSAVARSDPECRADRARLLPRPSRSALRRRPGAPIIRSSWPGSTASPRRCRPSPRPRSRRSASPRVAPARDGRDFAHDLA